MGKISFSKLASLRKLLNNYSQIAKQKQTRTTLSKKCEKCAFCGNNGKHKYMVFDKEILTIKGKTIILKPNLNCNSYGIYVAICTRCDSNYVEQTKNSFSTRWAANRFNWNRSKSNFNPKDISDENALYRHYYFKHKNNHTKLLFLKNQVLRT